MKFKNINMNNIFKLLLNANIYSKNIIGDSSLKLSLCSYITTGYGEEKGCKFKK